MKAPTALKIGDVIELPHVRTVIQLADVDDPRFQASLLDDFVLTAESDFALQTLLDSLAEPAGQGFFLQGSFGSGKSHLLTVLHLLLRSEEAWAGVERQSSRYRELKRKLSPGRGASAVASVSLVEHAGSASLEDICLLALESALKTPLGLAPSFSADAKAASEIRSALEARHRDEVLNFLREKSVDADRLFDAARPDLLDALVRRLDLPFRVRRERSRFFDTLASGFGGGGPRRAVLILDELSEFLRSKPDTRAFNEDVRFLQFLGEVSGRMPFFIVASLQERIETTGEIDQAAFGKIKDRYPVRLSLTGRHLKELASVRLIRKKPGAESHLSDVYRQFRQAFTGLDVSEADFVALYPIHPATLSLLDDLLPLFSRHRGAVDFIYHQLAGDPRRQIPGLLEREVPTLLGPEVILDHFLVRIRETIETAPYVTVALAYYEKELPRIFPGAEEREVALRLLKLLVLHAISPIRRRPRVAQLAQMLLYRVTDLDPAANYDYVRDLLEKMRREGAYLTVEEEDVYSLDLAADVQLILKRRVDALLNDPGFTFGRALEILLPFFASPLLPLGSLAASPRSQRRVSWQRTRREGVLLFARGEDDPVLSEATLAEIHQKLEETELDFCLILMSPAPEAAQKLPESELASRLRSLGPEPYLIWIPAPLATDGVGLVRRAAARATVREHYRAEGSEVGKRVVEALEPVLEEDRELSESVVARAYRQGVFVSPSGEVTVSPAELPPFPFDRLLDRLAQIPLDRRYPKHYHVAPTLELPPGDALGTVLGGFFRAGEVELRDAHEALRVALENHLKPMGLVKRTSSGFRLQVNPGESEIARSVLNRVGAERVPLDDLYKALRKGPFGLTRIQFDLVVLALVFSGQITAFSQKRKVSLDTLDVRGLSRVEAVGPGEMLAPDLQQVLGTMPFVPPRFREGTFGFVQQRDLWEHLVQWKTETTERVANLEAELKRAASYRSAAHLDLALVERRLGEMRRLLDEVKTSYSPREGLERLARACREEPEVYRVIEDFDAQTRFFGEEWERYLFIERYLFDPALEIGDGFEPLTLARDRLRALATRPEAPVAPDLVRDLAREFQEFQSTYGEAYEREHRLRKSPERIAMLVKVRDGKPYDALRRLSGIRIAVEDDRVKVDRLVEGALLKTCSRLAPEHLRGKPTCDCGFRLGEDVEFPSPAQAESMVSRGVSQYLKELGTPACRERIEPALFGLAEVGKNALVDRTRALLALSPEEPQLLSRLDTLLDAEVVGALNDALSGAAVLVSRQLEDLAESLLDRSFPKSKLLSVFERWIDGEQNLGPDDYVKVVSRSVPLAESRLRDFLARRYPELVLLWDQAGWRDALRELVLAYRGGTTREGADASRTRLLAEAMSELARESPDAAAQALDEAERALSPREREDVLARMAWSDEPAALLDVVFSERAFRFVARQGAARLLRMLTSASLGARLAAALAGVKEKTSDAPLAARLGHDALRTALECALGLQRTAGALEVLPENASSWEEVFREHLGLVETRLAELRRAVDRLGVGDSVDWASIEGPVRKASARASEKFQQFYVANSGALMLRDLFQGVARRFEQKLSPTTTRWVMMDGMRWDVWVHLKERLLPHLRATWRVVEERPLWSVPPTTTAAQLEAAGLTLPAEKSSTRPLPGFFLLSGPGGERVERLNLVDDKVHESSADLVGLLDEIELHCRRTLAVLLEEAARGTLLFLFADHGFRQDPGWDPQRRHDKPRYAHGGMSPFEVITPLVVLFRP